MATEQADQQPSQSEESQKPMGFRERIFHIIDNDQRQSAQSQFFEGVITVLILLSIISIILESFDQLVVGYSYYFELFESITLVVFTGEYVLRIFTADFKYPESKNWFSAAWKLMRSGSGIVDFLAISPLLFQVYEIDFRFLRALKISRLLRILKLSALTSSVTIVGDVFLEKRSELGITLFVTFILLLVSATLMWHVEGDAQPEAFPNIIATFWWAIATLTTVGYGDVYPITPIGKLLSGIIAVLGIGMVALPAGILSGAFVARLEEPANLEEEEKSETEEKESTTPQKILPSTQVAVATVMHSDCSHKFGQAFVYCPYCGEKLEEGEAHKH